MDRYQFDILRYSGKLLSGTSSWQSVGDVDDLTAYEGTREPFIAAATASASRRIILHRGAITNADQAVQATIDRVKPRRVGGLPIGLILLWKTAGCSPDAMFIDSSESDESGVVGQFTCQPVVDLTMGSSNHLRIEIEGDQLSIIERLEDEETTLWQMTIHPMHRRISLRAEHVDGTVTLWWNPDGIEEFFDAPVARVSTLLDGGARAGLISYEDGRFLSASVEYVLEQEAQSPVIKTAEEVVQDFSAVHVRVEPDLSRPPIQTGFLVAAHGASRRPECQQSESRFYLRDLRVLVTPGQTYRAMAWMRTVDGDMARGDVRTVLAVPGTAEDLRLRDDAGNLVLFSDEATPAGETRSTRDFAEFPASLRDGKAMSYPLDGEINPGEVVVSEYHDSVARGIHRAFTAPRVWRLSFATMSPTQREDWFKLLQTCRARGVPFLWAHPRTDEHVMVRFTDTKLAAQGVDFQTFESSGEIREDLWAFYVPTTITPPAPSTVCITFTDFGSLFEGSYAGLFQYRWAGDPSDVLDGHSFPFPAPRLSNYFDALSGTLREVACPNLQATIAASNQPDPDQNGNTPLTSCFFGNYIDPANNAHCSTSFMAGSNLMWLDDSDMGTSYRVTARTMPDFDMAYSCLTVNHDETDPGEAVTAVMHIDSDYYLEDDANDKEYFGAITSVGLYKGGVLQEEVALTDFPLQRDDLSTGDNTVNFSYDLAIERRGNTWTVLIDGVSKIERSFAVSSNYPKVSWGGVQVYIARSMYSVCKEPI